MNVKDLIELLKECPPDATVIHTVCNEDEDLFSSTDFYVNGIGENTDYIELVQPITAKQQL